MAAKLAASGSTGAGGLGFGFDFGFDSGFD